MLGDFGEKHSYGVEGRAWVEVKVFSEARYEKEVAKWKKRLAGELEAEHERDGTLQAVMLLAAKASRVSGGLWGRPTLHAMLLTRGVSSQWVSLANGVRRPARGQVQGVKKPLAQLWSKMEWHQAVDGQRVGLLRHFLGALGLPVSDAHKRAATLNGLLVQAEKADRKRGRVVKKRGRVQQKRLKGRTGKKPWVARKDTFRDVYRHL